MNIGIASEINKIISVFRVLEKSHEYYDSKFIPVFCLVGLSVLIPRNHMQIQAQRSACLVHSLSQRSAYQQVQNLEA